MDVHVRVCKIALVRQELTWSRFIFAFLTALLFGMVGAGPGMVIDMRLQSPEERANSPFSIEEFLIVEVYIAPSSRKAFSLYIR